MVYSIMDINVFQMVVDHLQSWINGTDIWEAQSESTAATTTNIHSSNLMQTHDVDEQDFLKVNNIGESSDVKIDKFFDRKVKIFDGTWNVGSAFAANVFPWEELFQNDAFRKKLDNFALFKGKLMLTFYVNGTPQHAGMLLASYNYMSVPNERVVIGGLDQSYTRSQRPHVYLNASTNKSGCLCVPFLFPTPYISCDAGPEPARDYLGKFYIDSLGNLLQINSGFDSINVSVFAQIMDVVLTAPTPMLFEAQSDEYAEDGPISGPASAVAEVAGLLEAVPVIQPFAVATRMAASTVSAIAKLFGYSKPVNIHPVTRVRNHPVSSLALTDDHDTAQKLTVTSKAELSIDPRLVEVEAHDTLSLKYLTQKESLLGSITWNTSAVVDDYFGTVQVNPMAHNRVTAISDVTVIPTSLSYVSRLFTSWSGTIRIRVQVIASQFHRGKFAILYYPTRLGLGTAANAYNTSYNMIIDLTEGRDFTFDVHWQNHAAYLPLVDSDVANYVSPTRDEPDNGSNGVLAFQVVNKLAVPDGTTPARLLISISAGDDFELVNPRGSTLNVSPFAFEAQSAVDTLPEEENTPEGVDPKEMTTKVLTNSEQKALNYYGERILSMRQMVKRYTYVRTVKFGTTTTGIQIYTMPLMAMPPERGYGFSGIDTTGGGLVYTYCNITYPGYLKRAFAGWKGAIRWKVVPISGIKQMSVVRRTDRTFDNNFRPFTNINIGSGTSTSVAAYEGDFGYATTGAGTALTQNKTMDALEFEIPYTLPYKFSRVNQRYATSIQNGEGNLYPAGNATQLRIVTDQNVDIIAFELYAAAGEDFQLIGYNGAPVYYKYPNPVA